MPSIDLEEINQTKEGWKLIVKVRDEEDSKYLVTLDKEYWAELTDFRHTRDELIRKSFGFLLERESKASIFKKFNFRDIQKYFPEYEKEIKKLLSNE